jgi:hypothetical protein
MRLAVEKPEKKPINLDAFSPLMMKQDTCNPIMFCDGGGR